VEVVAIFSASLFSLSLVVLKCNAHNAMNFDEE
jgi:hypothetical protein